MDKCDENNGNVMQDNQIRISGTAKVQPLQVLPDFYRQVYYYTTSVTQIHVTSYYSLTWHSAATALYQNCCFAANSALLSLQTATIGGARTGVISIIDYHIGTNN